MAEIPNPSGWLYNRPSEGIARDWYTRNRGVKMLDMAVVLYSSFENWDGQSNIPYSLDKVNLIQSGFEVYPSDPKLNRIWRRNTADLLAKGERIDKKMHLYGYSEAGDILRMVTSMSD